MRANKYIPAHVIPVMLLLAWGSLTGLAQPSNDLPCNAIELAISDSCSFSVYTNLDSGDSGLPDPGCGSYQGGDIWFYLVVPADSSFEIQTDTEAEAQFPDNDGWMYRAAIALYSGNCNTLTPIDCYADNGTYNYSRMAKASLTSETPGDTIWVRIWEHTNNDNGFFRICVTGSTGTEAGCPGVFGVTGGGSYCSGDSGVAVSLTGSEPGIQYTLLLNDTIRLDTLEGDGDSLQWSPIPQEGIYRIEAENPSDSCTVMMNDSTVIFVLEPPQVSADAVSTTCFGDKNGSITLEVEAETPYMVEWTGPGGFSSSDQSPINLSPGEYQVSVTDTNNCVTEPSAITLTEPDLLVATVEQVIHLTSYDAEDGSIELSITGGTTPYVVSWTGSDGYASSDKDPSGMSVGFYDVIVTDDHLCLDSIRGVTVSLAGETDGIFIPEGFSPNGDGSNDHFVILGIEQFPHNELVVFNRQGVEVLHRVNYENNWDGRAEKGGVLGGELSEGTYYYLFTYGESGIRKGYVYINRE